MEDLQVRRVAQCCFNALWAFFCDLSKLVKMHIVMKWRHINVLTLFGQVQFTSLLSTILLQSIFGESSVHYLRLNEPSLN